MVINAASELFREHGFDGIGLNDLMKGAGHTQGGFYKQFASKEDLAAQASRRAMEEATQKWSTAIAARPEHPLDALINFYLCPEHRDGRSDGCPLVALGADAARHGTEVKVAFEAGIKGHLEVLDGLISATDGEKLRHKSVAVLATMVGALLLSRAENDEALSTCFLDVAAGEIRRTVAA
jgi:TetR/AcrR family transcriptional repressor of nem operon